MYPSKCTAYPNGARTSTTPNPMSPTTLSMLTKMTSKHINQTHSSNCLMDSTNTKLDVMIDKVFSLISCESWGFLFCNINQQMTGLGGQVVVL